MIQEKEFTPLGSNEVMKVDVRILAATNADLRKMVEEKKFREDLYYRLNVININLPPLRDRREDIPLLIQHFLEKFSKENEKFLDANNRSQLRFEPEAMQLLLDHTWPGNVRELENVVERAVVLASTQVIPLDVLPDYLLHAGGIRLRRSENGALPPDASLFEIVADFERRTIIEQLERFNWSQTEAAEALRVPLSTLNQKIKRLNIDVKRRGEKSELSLLQLRRHAGSTLRPAISDLHRAAGIQQVGPASRVAAVYRFDGGDSCRVAASAARRPVETAAQHSGRSCRIRHLDRARCDRALVAPLHPVR